MKRKTPTKRNRSDYEVGYGRPPKATQFKKGTSGNKKGRAPKETKKTSTLIHEEMHQKVVVMENGVRRTITKLQAGIKQFINKAATGDPKAIQAMINFAKELEDLKLPGSLQEPQVRTIKFRIFDRDLETGQRVRVKPGTREVIDDDD